MSARQTNSNDETPAEPRSDRTPAVPSGGIAESSGNNSSDTAHGCVDHDEKAAMDDTIRQLADVVKVSQNSWRDPEKQASVVSAVEAWGNQNDVKQDAVDAFLKIVLPKLRSARTSTQDQEKRQYKGKTRHGIP